MKRILPIICLCSILFASLIQFVLRPGSGQVHAQRTTPVGRSTVEVSASVGDFYLNLSGFISPYASLVLTTRDGVFIRSTTADAGGNFSISSVLIQRGFSGFCITAIDFRRLGESVTCFSVPPAESSITMDNIFLPPTLGLSRTEIAAGSPVLAFGYTMPGAVVTIRLSNGHTYTTVADNTGYYEFRITDLPAGEYKVYATAHYHGLESLSPTKQLGLKSLSFWEQILKFLKELLQKLWDLLTGIFLNPLWLLIPLLILIIILLLKLFPERFTFIHEYKMRVFSKFSEKPLHHWWFVGY